MPKQIYLCGFMGSGKSTILKRLRTSQEINGYDLDELILEKTQFSSVGALVHAKGWDFFRALEQEIIKEFYSTPATSSQSFVLALGGGALNAPLAKILNERGELIWLNTPFELCYERILAQGETRPLLALGKVGLQKLFDERVSQYGLSKHHFSVEIQEKIVDLTSLRNFL